MPQVKLSKVKQPKDNIKPTNLTTPTKEKDVGVVKFDRGKNKRRPRSDSNTPLQKEKDKAVESFEKKFPGCKQRTWGLMHNILMGEKQFKSVGATDLKVLLELIDRIPEDIRDPVSRLTDMVQKAPSYLP